MPLQKVSPAGNLMLTNDFRAGCALLTNSFLLVFEDPILPVETSFHVFSVIYFVSIVSVNLVLSNEG